MYSEQKKTNTNLVQVVSLFLGKAFVAIWLVVSDRWRAAGERFKRHTHGGYESRRPRRP